MMLRPLIALVLAAASGACAARSEDPTSAYLAPGLRFATPPPRALGYSIEVRQLITARYGGELQSFEGILSIAGDRLQLINLDGFGRRAMTIERTGNALTYAREPWVPESLNPANILA